MIKKTAYIVILLLIFTSCKSKKTSTNNANTMLLTKVLDSYHNNSFKKKAIKATLKVKYKGKKTLPSVNASLRIEKDKVIWLSLSKLIFNVGKLKITPNKVQFYNNLDNTYFDGDFSLLSDFLGTEINFQQIQNILIGEAVFDLNKDDYKIITTETSFLFTPKKENKLFDIFFWLDATNFKTNKQEIRQEQEHKLLSIQYNEFEKVDGIDFPKHIYILAKEKNEINTVNIDYKNIAFDLGLRFPFTIPNGYKEIQLK